MGRDTGLIRYRQRKFPGRTTGAQGTSPEFYLRLAALVFLISLTAYMVITARWWM